MSLLLRYINLPHSKNVFINIFGNYLGLAVATLYFVVFTQVFKPADLGVLSILLTIAYLLPTVFSFGIPAAIYAHVPNLLPDKDKAMKFIKTNFIFVTVLSFISLAAASLTIPLLNTYVFKSMIPVDYYIVTFIGAGLLIWQNYIRDVLNAAGKFLHINIAITISNLIKFFILIGLALAGNLDIYISLIMLLIVGPLIVFAIVVIERRWIVTSFVKGKIDRETIKFGYTFTYFIATQLFTLATRADLFMIAYYLTTVEAGYYSVAQRIIIAIVTSADSITQVLSPQFAKVSTQKEVKKLLKHSFGYMMIPAGIIIAAMLTPTIVYELVFSQKYTISAAITRYLGFSYLLFPFAAVMLLFFLYTIKKPMYVLGANLILFITLILGNVLFIPSFGYMGPATSYLLAFVIVFIYIVIFFTRELRRLKK